MQLLVTGGAGFIGSNFVHHHLKRRPQDRIVTVDALTYAGNLHNLEGAGNRHEFVRADIADLAAMDEVFEEHEFDGIINLAAESHVDRSILDSTQFTRTNIVGTQVLMDLARKYKVGRFLQVSTDEVYGSLGAQGAFSESSPIAPNSPYAASKAAADLMVRAYVKTYRFPAIITRCSNNYGPRQFPEKLIPLMILNAIAARPLPVYGDGLYTRDWIHVEDHSAGLRMVFEKGREGEVYNIGAGHELKNLEVIHQILESVGGSSALIQFVADRPGHDRRYAIDAHKVQQETGWTPETTFAGGLTDTVNWYQENPDWVRDVLDGTYRDYYERMYDRRSKTLSQL